MSAYLDSLYDALRTVISAAWPDVDADGIFEAEHLDLMPVEDLTPPYAVISVSSMPKNDDWAVDTLAYQPVVDIYIVEAVSGPRSGIRARLEVLRDALWTTPLAFGQVMDIPLLDWSSDIEMNSLLAGKSLSQRVGKLQVDVLVGQTAAEM